MPRHQRRDGGQRALGGDAQVVAPGHGRAGQHRAGCGGQPGRDSVVGRVLRPAHQLLGVVGGVEQAAGAVAEVREHDVEQRLGVAQPLGVPGGAGQREQALRHVGVVLQDPGVAPGATVDGGPEQAPVHGVQGAQQVGADRRGLHQVGAVQQRPRLGQRGDGQPVPGGDHLVVAGRLRPGGAHLAQPVADPRVPLRVVGLEQPLQRAGPVLEGACDRDLELLGGPGPVLVAQRVGQLRPGPGVGEPLDAVGVRVQRRGEAALLGAQVSQQEVGGLQGHPAGRLGPGRPPQVDVDAQQQRVVVQHLLEVRHDPLRVHGVAREAAGQLVVHAAGGHRATGVLDQVESLAGTGCVAQQELQHHRRRELGRPAEAAVDAVVGRAQGGEGLVEQLRRHVGGRDGRRPGQPRDDVGAGGQHVLATGLPGLRHRLEHLPEARHAPAGLDRPVRAAEEGLAPGGQEAGHRPAAVTGHGLHGLHVDGVDVRSLLAVDLDVDVVLVHVRRGGLVLEGLVRHDMAPVAGGVADGQQHRHVTALGLGERLRPPLLPVDRVVLVLPEVRAGARGEAVRHAAILPGAATATGRGGTLGACPVLCS